VVLTTTTGDTSRAESLITYTETRCQSVSPATTEATLSTLAENFRSDPFITFGVKSFSAAVYSVDHSALWRHGAILCSRRLIKLKLTSPIAASRITVTNNFGLSQVSDESRSM